MLHNVNKVLLQGLREEDLCDKVVLRFFAQIVVQENGCWEWQKIALCDRYGNIWAYGKREKAHRFAYSLYKGEIPKGLNVLHTCDNTKCVNPAHLFIGTQKDNIDDMYKKGRDNNVYGERVHTAKLNVENVISIRKDTRSGAVIAKEYGVSSVLICAIKRRAVWKQVV
jgi:hypothetical protein